MKRLIGFAVTLLLVFAAYSQNNPEFEAFYMAMKSDEVLSRIYFDLSDEIGKSIDYTNRCNIVAAPIRLERDAALQHLQDSLGIKPRDKYDTTPYDTLKYNNYIQQCQQIDNSFYSLELEAQSEIRQQYQLLLQTAFMEAAKKYFDNAEIMKTNK
jgi:hypothetical protein